MIVSIDTSSALTSVALTDHDSVVAELSHHDARRHAEIVAPMLGEILAGVDRSQLRAVAVGVGPGPYTGLRVGIATAKALSAAWQLPVYGLCSLDAVAEAYSSAGTREEFGVASDARRHEVYWAWYDDAGERSEGPRVDRPDDIDARWRDGRWLGALADDDSVHSEFSHPLASWVGRRVNRVLSSGALASGFEEVLSDHGGDGGPTSDALRGLDLLPARPLYLRRPDARPASAR